MKECKRAFSVEQKELVIKAILEVWKSMPELRLGQLLECARPRQDGWRKVDMFYTEDFELVDELKEFELRYKKTK